MHVSDSTVTPPPPPLRCTALTKTNNLVETGFPITFLRQPRQPREGNFAISARNLRDTERNPPHLTEEKNANQKDPIYDSSSTSQDTSITVIPETQLSQDTGSPALPDGELATADAAIQSPPPYLQEQTALSHTETQRKGEENNCRCRQGSLQRHIAREFGGQNIWLYSAKTAQLGKI